MPLVSVIVPVYGVEKYIERCATSLFKQTLNGIEFIFVDDCTPDHSMDILKLAYEKNKDELAKKKQIIKFQKMPENGGLAAVRKYGYQSATGDYIIYCDSDDWVDPQMYEKLYKHATMNNSDLVFCDYTISNGKTQENKIFNKNILDCSRKGVFKRLLTSSDLNPVWSAMAKRDVFEGLMFPVGAMSEDKTIMMQLSWKANKITYLAEPLYYYFLSETSILRTINKEANIRKFKQITDNRYILLHFFKRENIKIPQMQLDAFVFSSKIGFIDSFMDDPQCKKLWNETFPLSPWKVLLNPYITIKKKIRFIVTIWKQR